MRRMARKVRRETHGSWSLELRRESHARRRVTRAVRATWSATMGLVAAGPFVQRRAGPSLQRHAAPLSLEPCARDSLDQLLRTGIGAGTDAHANSLASESRSVTFYRSVALDIALYRHIHMGCEDHL